MSATFLKEGYYIQSSLRIVRGLTVKVLTLIVSRFGLTVWSEVQRLVGSVGVEALPD